MAQIGYISSFLEADGLGFLRGVDNPQDLVLFRRAAIHPDLADHVSIIGLEVEFELAPAGEGTGDGPDDGTGAPDDQREAQAVRPHVAPPDPSPEPPAPPPPTHGPPPADPAGQ